MRMRKKKHLEQRLEECSDYIFFIEREDRNFQSVGEKEYLDFKKIFENDNPVHLEIGCGKGRFSCETAKNNPELNILALEKASNVIVNGAEYAKKAGLKNLYFIRGGAEYLECYIPKKSIERIYLNFSCPFPKKKYASHRLTHHNFLKIYKTLLKDNAEIWQKTDNTGFFEFSIEEFSQNGFALKNVTFDLHNSGFEGNIMTEYEKKFSEQGLPIYRLEAYIK